MTLPGSLSVFFQSMDPGTFPDESACDFQFWQEKYHTSLDSPPYYGTCHFCGPKNVAYTTFLSYDIYNTMHKMAARAENKILCASQSRTDCSAAEPSKVAHLEVIIPCSFFPQNGDKVGQVLLTERTNGVFIRQDSTGPLLLEVSSVVAKQPLFNGLISFHEFS